MGIDFYQTGMARKFYERDIPALVRAIERLADAIEELNKNILMLNERMETKEKEEK